MADIPSHEAFKVRVFPYEATFACQEQSICFNIWNTAHYCVGLPSCDVSLRIPHM